MQIILTGTLNQLVSWSPIDLELQRQDPIYLINVYESKKIGISYLFRKENGELTSNDYFPEWTKLPEERMLLRILITLPGKNLKHGLIK